MNIGLVDWKGYFDRNIYVQNKNLFDEDGNQLLEDDMFQEKLDDMKFYIYRDFMDWIHRFELDKLIISFESGNWRKEYFPLYKYRRKLKRSKSDINWNFWYSWAKELEEEFKTLPLIVCHHPKLEADDVNAILCKYYVYNGHNVTIFGNDQDYCQLFRYRNQDENNVILYNTAKDMFVDSINYQDMLYKAIIQGQKKDDIPSGLKKTLVHEDFRKMVGDIYPEFLDVKEDRLHGVINDNYSLIQPLVLDYYNSKAIINEQLKVTGGKKLNTDVFYLQKTKIEYEVKGKMKSLTFDKYVDVIKQMGFDKWLDSLDDEIIVEQIKRNRVLMDFEFIPQNFVDDVIDYVQNYTYNRDNSYVYTVSRLNFEKRHVMNNFGKLETKDMNKKMEEF